MVNCYRFFFFWKITYSNISKIWCKEFLIGCLSQEKKNRWGHLTCNLPILWSTQSVFKDIFRLGKLNKNRLHQNKAFINGFRWVVCKINSDYFLGRSLTFFYFWNHPLQPKKCDLIFLKKWDLLVITGSFFCLIWILHRSSRKNLPDPCFWPKSNRGMDCRPLKGLRIFFSKFDFVPFSDGQNFFQNFILSP